MWVKIVRDSTAVPVELPSPQWNSYVFSDFQHLPALPTSSTIQNRSSIIFVCLALPIAISHVVDF